MVDSESYQGVERRAEPRAPSSAELKILVVDDSKTIVTVLRKMLSQNGYTVFTAVDGKEAIELATQHRPDVIFLDIVMPGMNGFAALRGLRRGQETRSIPVIMMSGNEQATEEFYVQRIGADDFMKKPFSRAEVFARIERLLANRNTAAQAQG
ncbi:MAG: response regulator [Pseudomonadota bacterium]